MQSLPSLSSEDHWSRTQLTRMNEADRVEYEQACDAAEFQLRSGLSIAEVVASIDCLPRLRSLVLLNIGKCLLEREPDRSPNRIEMLLLGLIGIDGCRSAQDELRAFAAMKPVEETSTSCPRTHSSIPSTHELVSHLPSNGLAELYLVRRKSLDRIECLKIVNLSRISEPTLVDQIKEEAVRASKLSHPGLIQVFDAGEFEGHDYICMEYMNGGSLADRISSGPLPWQTAMRLIATAARALDALHTKAGLAHGDIKPGNLLFTRTSDGEELFKIADFGLSSELLREAQSSVDSEKHFVFGTPGYIAPELLTTAQHDLRLIEFDHRVTADVFALGVTAYEILSGNLPYQSTNTVDPFGVLKEQYRSLSECVPGIPSVVAYVVKRACAVDRKERYVSAKEFARAIEQCLGAEEQSAINQGAQPVSATTMSSSGSSPKWNMRKVLKQWQFQVLAALVALAVILLALAVILPFLRLEDSTATSATLKPFDREKWGRSRISKPRKTIVPDVERLTAKGMSLQSADALISLNKDWFSALRASEITSKHAGTMLDILSDIDETSIGSGNLVASPHVAVLWAYPTVAATPRFVEWVRTDEQKHFCCINLLIQHPFSESISNQIPHWVTNEVPLAMLMKNGMYGGDRMIVCDGDDGPEFKSWINDILVEQIRIDPSQSNQWLLYFLDNHDAIRARMKDESFNRVFQRTWRRFVGLAHEHPRTANDFAFNGDAWTVLSMERGDDLIKKYGLLPVAMLTGVDSFPNDNELRGRVVENLVSGYSPIIECFSNKDLRQNPDFCNLLRKALPQEVFTSLCSEINAGRSSGKSIAIAVAAVQKSREHLIADHAGVDVNRWAAEKLVPHFIYLRVGLKMLSGKSLYDVEKRALLKRIAFDVVTYGAPIAGDQFGIDANQVDAFVQTFPQGYEFGEKAVLEVIQQERLKALAKYERASDSSIDAALTQQKELHAEVCRVTETILHKGEQTVLDVTNVMRLFGSLTVGDSGILPQVDLRQVRFLRLPDGRLFPGIVTTRGVFSVPQIKNFFDERWMTLASSEHDLVAKEAAWRQMVSAWLLLGAADLIPKVSK